MNLSKIKNLIPVPTDGADAVNYEIIPSVGAIIADSDGNVEASPITLSAYKTIDGTRSTINLTIIRTNGKSEYKVQYSADGATWKDCSVLSLATGLTIKLAYGVPGTAVQAVKSTLALRLMHYVDSSYVTVHQAQTLMVVKDGATGGEGKAGKYYYFAKYFDATKEYTQTDNAAPYVAFEYTDTDSVVKTNYYMLVASTNKVDGELVAPRTTAASGIWELMTTDFAYMIAEAIFSNFAKLGSAIFSGDWMISQYGNKDMSFTKDYQLFDPETFESGEGWVPRLAIDFMAGRVVMQDALVRGTVYAEDGEFSGSLKAATGYFSGYVYHEMLDITTSNYSEYVSQMDEDRFWQIDYKKTGNFVNFASMPECPDGGSWVIYLPFLQPTGTYTDSQKEEARKMVGQKLFLYNNSDKTIGISTFCPSGGTPSGSSSSFVIATGKMAILECKMEIYNRTECIYWTKDVGNIK